MNFVVRDRAADVVRFAYSVKEQEKTARALEKELADLEDVRFALLYGSRADGTAHADSDIDVAVFASERLSARERFELRLLLAGRLAGMKDVDVVILNDAPPLLRHRALKGILVHCKDRREYVRFFTRAVDDWLDQRHWSELFRQKRMERLREGKFGRP